MVQANPEIAALVWEASPLDCVAVLANKAEEWDILSDEGGFSGVPYSSSLSKTWQASVSQLDRNSLSILSFLSFFDPDCIQNQFIEMRRSTPNFPKFFPDTDTSVKWRQSIRNLLCRGLIEQMKSSNTMRMHRLVQTVTLHAMNDQDRQEFFSTALDVIAKGHPQSQDTGDTLFKCWNVCAVYAPHVQRLQELQESWQLNTASTSSHFNLFFNSSWYLLETGFMDKALTLARCAEQQLKGNSAETTLQRASLYNTYGVVALQHGEFDAAETWFRETQTLRERHLTTSHALVVGVTLNLVLLLLNQMRPEDAVGELKKRDEEIKQDLTLPIRYRSGVDDFLAEAYLFLGHYDIAWECLQRSIAMTRETLPLESQGSGYYYFTQGNIRSGQGRLAEAFQYHMLGLEVRRKVLGNHIQTAGSCYRVGDIAARMGNLPEAIERLHEAKEIYGKLSLIGNYASGGKARVSWRLSQIYAESGKEEKAKWAKREAMELFREASCSLKETPTTEDFEALVPPLDR
ncbi:TPR-like protein [Fusarium austroafricanum]|uniref:TPR-like protein n=1 Tax=Fusarium austroafricanum TaxID=2364996 RepID=A0A8H4KDH7_9HYPO|nr:TPR-like protein [Fusarium austroafricanum]